MLNPTSEELQHEVEWVRCELHDGACQYVTAAMTILQAFRRRADAGTISADFTEFDVAIELMDRATVELRRVVRGLPSVQVGDGGIVKAVEQLIAECQDDSGIEVEFCCDGRFQELPHPLSVAILRIVQEALSNVRRHSQSSHVLVGLTEDMDSIDVQVQDWGVGFDPADSGRLGHGLKGIVYRARSLGGTASIDACPGKGSCIMVELPIHRPE